jgi:hypothetical protein
MELHSGGTLVNPADRATLDEMLIAGHDDVKLARAAREHGDNLQALRCLSAADCYLSGAKTIVRDLERKARR